MLGNTMVSMSVPGKDEVAGRDEPDGGASLYMRQNAISASGQEIVGVSQQETQLAHLEFDKADSPGPG